MEGLGHLRECFRQAECPRIDYDRYGPCFAFSYFLENYWKAAAAFRRLRAPLVARLVDAGCGSGAAALAYLTTLETRLARGAAAGSMPAVHVILVDRSQAQLELARAILQDAAPLLPHLDVRLHPQRAELAQWHVPAGSVDAFLFGHVLNENRDAAGLLLQKARQAIGIHGRIYVLERKDDGIWPVLEGLLDGLPLHVRRGLVTLATSEVALPAGHPAREEAWIHTGYLMLERLGASSSTSS